MVLYGRFRLTRITLERTLRLPEDKKLYKCPLLLGLILFLQNSERSNGKLAHEVLIPIY
jgi:hypothetical protein